MSSQSRVEAQLIIARDLLEEAGSLGIDVSKFKKRLSNIEKTTPENLPASVASLMRDLSGVIEEFKRAEEKEAASTAAKMESKLAELRGVLEEARSVGVDVSRFETGLSKLEKSFGESKFEVNELNQLHSTVDTLKSELAGVVESFKREAEKQPTALEAEIYEHLMKHGGLSVSTYSKELGLTEEETRKAIDRLVELDMIEVRKV